MTKVSVVVPVYNPGGYIQACIDSLLQQSMPAGEFEAIFVDDGSTDETPALLDAVAAEHAHIQVIHQENSGWPGKPRNVGIEAAQGEYVFFCDNDDWFGVEALQRLYDFAVDCGSDVVLPKMAGLGRPVPHHVFRRTVRKCSLADAPIMDSLTPHKLFRRAFLNEHQIRFPEGKRRLEDHLFVSTAYLLAQTISIYADYTCYFHIRREDSSNAGFRKIDWHGYFDNLAESLDVVVAHTEPGPERDRIFRRWLQVEMVNRLSGARRMRMDPQEADDLLANAHRIAVQYFGPGVVELMQPASQPVGRAIIAGDGAEVRRLAETAAPWRTNPQLLQAAWTNGTLQIAGTVELTDTVPAAAPAEEHTETGPAAPAVVEAHQVEENPSAHAEPPLAERLLAVFGELSADDLADAQLSSSVSLDLTERRTGARWPVPATVFRRGLGAAFVADIDIDTLAAGARLPDGLWDLNVHYGVLGLSQRKRAILVPERRPGLVLAEPGDGGPTAAAYFTAKTSAFAIDVGLIQHKKLRPKPVKAAAPPTPAATTAPPPAPNPPARKKASLARRAVRKLRRTLSG